MLTLERDHQGNVLLLDVDTNRSVFFQGDDVLSIYESLTTEQAEFVLAGYRLEIPAGPQVGSFDDYFTFDCYDYDGHRPD